MNHRILHSSILVATLMMISGLAFAASAPASGIKPLYMGDIEGTQNAPVLPMPLGRTPLVSVSDPQRVRIRRQDNNHTWALTPPLQDSLSISGGAIPVTLQMRRANNTALREIRVTLAYLHGGNSTRIGCLDRLLATSGSEGLSNSETRAFQFNIWRTDADCNTTSTSGLTIPAGAQITLAIDNQVGGVGNGRAVFVYPFNNNTPDTSRIELNANTVINVDSMGLYADAYPNNTSVTDRARGEVFYVRAVVSDPFGTSDISSVDYLVTNASGNPAGSGTLTKVADSGSNTATYEAMYTVPLAGPDGNWDIAITAHEGTEGTVSHTDQTGFAVTGVDMLLEKEVSVIADQISTIHPKAIPAATLQYVIRVANLGANALTADTLVLEDSLPEQIRMFLGGNPFNFVYVSNPGGLTFTYNNLADPTDDVQFSNDGGNTFTTPSINSLGYDITEPKINFIELNPKGVLAAEGQTGSSFELSFMVQVE